MHCSPWEWMRAFQLCSLKNKNSRFLKSACDVGLMVRVAVYGAEPGRSPFCSTFAFAFI